MGLPLTGSSVASTYTGLLKNADNSTVGATLKAISDGSGNDSALQISSVAVNTTGDLSVATNKLTVAAATGNTAIAGTLNVTGVTSLSSLATSGAATIGGALNVTGATTLTGNLTIPGNLAVTGTSTLTGNTAVTGTIGVTGASTLASVGVTGAATVGTTLGVTGASTLASLGVTGAATVGTTLGVTGASTLASLGVTGAATVGTTLGVTGAATLASVGVTGAATVGTTLGVTGASTLASVGITGAATVGTTLGVTGNTTLTGDLAANGNTTLGNAGTDTLTLNSDNITVPNLTPVVVDFTADKVLITDASDSSKVKLVAGTYFSPQVKQTLYKDSTAGASPFVAISTTSGTEITVLTTSITPRSTTSNVLVTVAINYTGSNLEYGAFRITRNGTEIGSNNIGSSLYGIASSFGVSPFSILALSSQFIQILDTLTTGAAATYKIHLYSTGPTVFTSIWLNKTAQDVTNGVNDPTSARVSSSMTLQEYFA